jgi:hypothetical protein
MTPSSLDARRVALRLLTRGGALSATESDGSDPVAATEEMFRHLDSELSRWFGPFGFHALFSRALAEARVHHPALDSVRIHSAAEPSLDGLSESTARYGADAVTEGVIASLMGFIDLLSRLIGEDMTLKLLDQPVPLREPQAGVPNKGGDAS